MRFLIIESIFKENLKYISLLGINKRERERERERFIHQLIKKRKHFFQMMIMLTFKKVLNFVI